MNVLILGAGQLARMMALAGAPLNIYVKAYDLNSAQVINPVTLQPYTTSLETEIEKTHVITAEFEHVPLDLLNQCEQSGKLKPHAAAIKVGGDRRLEKTLLDQAQVSNADFRIITNYEAFNQCIKQIGLPLVLKTALGGYDGKGQWQVKSMTEAAAAWQEIEVVLNNDPDQAIIAESFIPFDYEVSIVGVRDQNGLIKTYPLAQNSHKNGILRISSPINNTTLQQKAEQSFRKIAESLNYVGVLAIEFFVINDQLLVNEIAPRVHNSGHWTQQGSITCQFENHLRAVCGLHIGSTESRLSTAMINILGIDQVPSAILELNDIHLHWYNKPIKPFRKMGHINICGSTDAELYQKLSMVTSLLAEPLPENIIFSTQKI